MRVAAERAPHRLERLGPTVTYLGRLPRRRRCVRFPIRGIEPALMGNRARITRLSAAVVTVATATLATLFMGPLCARARAEEAAPRVMSEPTEYTDVIDAFDAPDPFDINMHLAFMRSVESSSIDREVAGGPGTRYTHVADSTQTLNSLLLGVDVGLYQDLMVFVRLPLVLSDTRSLRLPSGGTCGSGPCAAIDAALRDVPAADSGSGYLFDPSFTSPTRSGVPDMDIGVSYGITNQFRKATLPTWVVSAQNRLSIGHVMEPCASGTGCNGGISRGTARILLESRWSYRVRYLEPYLGVSYAHEWATSGKSGFSPGGALPGYVDITPPHVLEGTLGVSIIPWEERGRFQRFAIDLRGRASYVSAGRDYTPLFDALGVSPSAFLTTPNSDQLVTGGSGGKRVPFTGLSNVDAHMKLGVETAFVMQAAQYIRFRLGFGFAYQSAHLLTNADRCNADVHVALGDPRGGSCAPSAWNPLYRPVIDLPGQRFRLSGDLIFDLFAAAVAQF